MKKRPITQDQQIVVRVPADLRKAIKSRAELEQRPEAYLVREALRDWLDTPPSQAAA